MLLLEQIFHAFLNQAHHYLRVTNARGGDLPLSQDLAVHAGESKTQAGASNIGAYDIARLWLDRYLLRTPTGAGGFLLPHRLNNLGYRWIHCWAYLQVLWRNYGLPRANTL